VKRFWRISTTLVSVYYALMIEYRAEIFLWIVAGSFPLIMMGIWMKASTGGATARTPGEFARYFFAVFLVRQFTTVWVIYEFETDVNDVGGRLSPFLLQPLDPAFRYLTTHISERLSRLPFLVAFILAFFWLFPAARWPPSAGAIGLAILAGALAFLLRFAMQYTFAMFAFWTERASSIDQLSFVPYFFFSGLLAPLDLFPAAARHIAELTPFPYVLYFPAQILIGGQVRIGIGLGFAVMTAWTVVFFLLNRLLWKRGLRQFSGMGA
jgi:ABC-2 type transport system permease protein